MCILLSKQMVQAPRFSPLMICAATCTKGLRGLPGKANRDGRMTQFRSVHSGRSSQLWTQYLELKLRSIHRYEESSLNRAHARAPASIVSSGAGRCGDCPSSTSEARVACVCASLANHKQSRAVRCSSLHVQGFTLAQEQDGTACNGGSGSTEGGTPPAAAPPPPPKDSGGGTRTGSNNASNPACMVANCRACHGSAFSCALCEDVRCCCLSVIPSLASLLLNQTFSYVSSCQEILQLSLQPHVHGSCCIVHCSVMSGVKVPMP